MGASLLKVRGRFGGCWGRPKSAKSGPGEGQNRMLKADAEIAQKHRKLQKADLHDVLRISNEFDVFSFFSDVFECKLRMKK